ncbi:YjjG family noncanonical pyrimidine nucleotidase [Lacticaseibacillus jixiensis]|uniref:YjjG family noncanonical pyrimidine nucleotidase n=1 Tax=Lacticaseibacillus jixiensis TaxID=3231926 RepID=UPI0036F1DEF5
MYQNLFFDVDDTLLDFEAGELKSLRLTMSKQAIAYTPRLEAAYLQINAGLWRQYEAGTLARAQIFTSRMRELFKQLHIAADPLQAEKDYRKALDQQAILIPRAAETLTALRDYHLYVVSNGIEATQIARLTKSGLIDYFDNIFVSDTIGAPKPTVAFFDYVAKKTPHYDPATSLIIGDSLTSDIQGGLNAHMDTVWFNPRYLPNRGLQKPTYTLSDFSDLTKIVNAH